MASANNSAMCFGRALVIAAFAPDYGEFSLRNDAVRANGKGNDSVTVNHKENAVFFSDIKIENLVAMPEDACELVTTKRRMPPVC